MREIGTIAGEKEARAVADYLLTLNITTKLDPKGDAWALWVHREERLAEARTVLADFEANPNDPRFASASRTAHEIRKKAVKVEKDYSRRVKDFRDRWEGAMYHRAPVVFGLIVASVIITGIQLSTEKSENPVFSMLSFSTYVRDPDRTIRDTGFEKIFSGEVWRLLTPVFMHINLIHLFCNMLGLRIFGERIEMRKGPWRFALIALVSGIAGDIGQYEHSGGNFCGMSGVVFGLAGYLWIKGYTDPTEGLSLSQPNVNLMVGWFVLGVAAEVLAGSSPPDFFFFRMGNVAHGVGLAVGMIFALLRF